MHTTRTTPQATHVRDLRTGACSGRTSQDMSVGDRLRTLSDERGDDFAQEVRNRVAPHEAQECEKNLRSLVLMMPQLLARLGRLWEHPDVPSGLRRLSGYVRTYLYHPDDVIPENGVSLFGYVDDAYLIGAVYLRVADSVPYGHPLKRGQEWGLLLRTRALISSARRVVPAEAEEIDTMVNALVAGDEGAFQQVFAAPCQDPDEPAGECRRTEPRFGEG